MNTTLAAPEAPASIPRLIPPAERERKKGLHLWTRDEYHRMAEPGLFDDKRVELLDGKIWERPAQLTPHAVAVGNTQRALEAAFGAGCFARDQAPVVLNGGSEPEPDVVIVPGVPNDYYPDHPHPTQIAVLVEVSDSTLRDDRGKKARAHARAGITDYWIVNLVHFRLEVHRVAQTDGQYQDVQVHSPDETITPLALPHAVIHVADLLPPPHEEAPA